MLEATRVLTARSKKIQVSQIKSIRRPGAAMLEFAIVLPILLTLVLGIVEMGRVMMLNQVATNATREACRRAVIPGATDAAVTKIVHDYLNSAGVSEEGRTVSVLGANGQSASLVTLRSHDPVTIEVQFPYAGNTWGFTRFVGGASLVSRATMRRE